MPVSAESSAAQAALARAAADAFFPQSIERLCDLLRIASVSTDPAFNDDVRRAAEWCRDQLGGIGFDATCVDTEGHPVVLAHRAGPAGAPHVLYYAHYDVQPADPLELWNSPPFEPVIEPSPHGQKVVARGAVDDKGQLMTMVEAFRAWHDAVGAMPISVTVMLEGEEESGSPSLAAFLEAHRDALKADVCVVSDTGMWDVRTPAITTMLRGLVYIEATLHGPSHDLHSGMYGGAVVNPNNALARILGELHDQEGRVQIPGFYDDVEELAPEQKAQWESMGFDDAEFLGSAGLEHSHGEKGRSVLERTWSRPTCDVNGMWGGYIGRGAKTVIPAQASAKISCRLVANQDPVRIEAALRGFLEARTPPGCRWSFQRYGCDPAFRVRMDSPHLIAAQDALREVYGTEAKLIGTGGSIPVVGMLKNRLGLDSLLVGFGLDDDRVHSPNEKFELACYQGGIRSHIALLARLANA